MLHSYKRNYLFLFKDYEDLKDFIVCYTQQGQNYQTYTQRCFKNYVLEIIFAM